MNLTEIIENALIDTHEEEDIQVVTQHIADKLAPHLRTIIEMRYAQRSYFRRKNEDNLSKAKSLEKLVDYILQPFDEKANIPVQIDAFPINY